MFALADCAYYMATLALVGREALTVTTSAAIDFMRKPAPGGLVAEARVLKLGRSLSVGDVLIFSEGSRAGGAGEPHLFDPEGRGIAPRRPESGHPAENAGKNRAGTRLESGWKVACHFLTCG